MPPKLAKVLIVEDHKPLREALARAVSAFSAEVVQADDVRSAEAQLAGHPDVVLVDVWLPDGSEHALASRPLMWRALECLADAGGEASLEHLARSLWDIAEYHPHRDNPRIHTLVSRIRQWLEPSLGEPTRLITTTQGYRFGSAEPVRRLCLPRARNG